MVYSCMFEHQTTIEYYGNYSCFSIVHCVFTVGLSLNTNSAFCKRNIAMWCGYICKCRLSFINQFYRYLRKQRLTFDSV